MSSDLTMPCVPPKKKHILFAASCSEDCTIKVWEIPEGGLTEDMRDPIADLQGHERKVGEIQWHPVAKDILISSAFDWTIR